MNETNEMWRAVKADAKTRGNERAVRWMDRINELSQTGKLDYQIINMENSHIRLRNPTRSAKDFVDLYLTRGTLVYKSKRLEQHGLEQALKLIEVEQ